MVIEGYGFLFDFDRILLNLGVPFNITDKFRMLSIPHM